MDKILHHSLDYINEGIVILNESLQVIYVNKYMAYLTGISLENMLNFSLYEILPSLNKKYFIDSMESVTESGCKMFLSAALHKELAINGHRLNLKISKANTPDGAVILFEFVDVTSQFFRINQLKECVTELHQLNKKLKEREKVIKKLAYYDKLTGVANRTLFYKLSETILERMKKNDSLLGLMFIDVDKFKAINDTYGHEIGDRVLVRVANILKEATRENDVVARYGGDEFLILLPNVKDFENYKGIVNRIINTKNNVIVYGTKQIDISLSIGVSFYPSDARSIDELIVKADKAMYVAKNKSGTDNCFYT